MLNYRFVTILLLVFCVIFPLVFYWINMPDGAWYRPYQFWFLGIVGVWLWQRHSGFYEINDR